MSQILSVDGLAKRFGRHWVFQSLSFDIAHGEVLVVTGANGSGKSTLLQVVAGLQEPTAGKVSGRPADARNWLSFAALDQALYPSLTAAEHFELAGKLRGCEPRTTELLERIGLPEAGNVFALHLSTGMRARLKLGLAVQSRPSLLLLDEPGAGLDEEGLELVRSIVEEQKGRGAAIVATNDPAERRFASHELKLAD